MIAVLHTWGQNLHYHPHIHCLVPAGGLTKHGEWVAARKNYLVPVRALSALFRAKYISFLRRAHRQGKLKLEGPCADLGPYPKMNQLLNKLYQKNWVVYAKEPLRSTELTPKSGPEKLLDYLGRYIKRIAISNERILNLDVDRQQVAFRWRDYADQNRSKVMDLSCEEFIRRFLQHILPKGFSKVRYYGLLANRDKSKRLRLSLKALGHAEQPKLILSNWQERFYQLTGLDPTCCPCCEQGKMQMMVVLLPVRAPPVHSTRISPSGAQ